MDWLDYLPQVLSISRALPQLPSRLILEIASFLDYDAVTYTDDSTTRFAAANPRYYENGDVRTDTATDLGHDLAYLQGRGEAVHPPPEVLEAYSSREALDDILSAYAHGALPHAMALPPLCGQGYGVFDRVHVPVAVVSDKDTIANPYVPCAVPLADRHFPVATEGARPGAASSTASPSPSNIASTSASASVNVQNTPVDTTTVTTDVATTTEPLLILDGGAASIDRRYKYAPNLFDPEAASNVHEALLLSAIEAETMLLGENSDATVTGAMSLTRAVKVKAGMDIKAKVKVDAEEEEAKEGPEKVNALECVSRASMNTTAVVPGVLRPVFGEGFRQCVPVATTSTPISVSHTRYSAAQLHALHLALTRIAINDLTNANDTVQPTTTTPPILPLTHRPYLGSPLSLLSLQGYIDAEDQGWGNQKGALLLCLNRPSTGQQWHFLLTAVKRRGGAASKRCYFSVSRADLLSGRWNRADTEHYGTVGLNPFTTAIIPPHKETPALFWPAKHVDTVLKHDTTEVAAVAQHLSTEEPGHLPGDFLSLRVLVGGGGGHALTVERFSVQVKVDVARELQNNAELLDAVIRADRARHQRITEAADASGSVRVNADDNGRLVASNKGDVDGDQGTGGVVDCWSGSGDGVLVLEYGTDRYPLRLVANVDVDHIKGLHTRICKLKKPQKPTLTRRVLSNYENKQNENELLCYGLLRNKAVKLLRKRKSSGNDREAMQSLVEALARDASHVLSDMHISVYADSIKGKVLSSPLRVPMPRWAGAGVAGAALRHHGHDYAGGLACCNARADTCSDCPTLADPHLSAENDSSKGVVAHDGGIVEDLEVQVPVLFFTQTSQVPLVNSRAFNDVHVANLVHLLRVAGEGGAAGARCGNTSRMIDADGTNSYGDDEDSYEDDEDDEDDDHHDEVDYDDEVESATGQAKGEREYNPVVVPIVFPRGLARKWLSGHSYY